jgi:hypothetical protein
MIEHAKASAYRRGLYANKRTGSRRTAKKSQFKNHIALTPTNPAALPQSPLIQTLNKISRQFHDKHDLR